jgi:hypothetical protein
MLHLSRQFHEDCYNAIEAFQGEKKINVHMHVRDLQEQNGVYVQPKEELQKHFILPSNYSFMQDLCRGHVVPKDNQEAASSIKVATKEQIPIM